MSLCILIRAKRSIAEQQQQLCRVLLLTMSNLLPAFKVTAFSLMNPKVETLATETIKWRQRATSYEVAVPMLCETDPSSLIPHCIYVRRKILAAVTTPAHVGPLLYNVFNRTLSLILDTVWTQINAAADAEPAVNNARTEANFDNRSREFIAAHTTKEDRNDLLTLLRHASKSQELTTQNLYYKMLEFNSCIR